MSKLLVLKLHLKLYLTLTLTPTLNPKRLLNCTPAPPVPAMHSGHDLATALLQLAMLKENASSNSNVHAPEQFHVES